MSPAAFCDTHGCCLSLLVLELEKWFSRKQCCFHQRHINFKHATQIQHSPQRIPSTRVALLGPGGHHCLLLTPPRAREAAARLSSPASHLHPSKQRTLGPGSLLPGSVHQIWLRSAAKSVTHGNKQPWSRPRRELRHLILHVPQEPRQSLKERQRGALPMTRRGICPPPPAPLADALSSGFCHSFLHDSNPQGAVLHGGQSLRPAASSGEERVMDDPCQGPIPVCVTPLLAAGDSPQQEASPQDLPCTSTALHGSEPRAQEQYVVPTDTSRDTSPTRLRPQSQPRASGPGHPCPPASSTPTAAGDQSREPGRGGGELL